MENSAAYRLGEMVGAIMAVLIIVGICVFFIIALIKAITTRRTGWIVGACISGLPVVAFIILVLVGLVIGFRQGLNHSSELSAARRGEPSQLLTATLTPVTGNAFPYEISLPLADAWLKNDSRQPFDYLFSYRDAYVGVICEGIGVGTPDRIAEISRKNLASKATTLSTTPPKPVQIDSHSWLTYDADATLRGINIKYRFYVYADADHTIQIITWTGPALFDRDAPVFDRIAQSFKLPK